MKTLKLAVLTLALMLLPSLAAAQNFTLTQTTLSAAIKQGQTSFVLASVTNVTGTGAINNAVGGTTGGNANTTSLYIDRELMTVVSVNTTAKSVSVLRGQGGTQASAHQASTMVLAGSPLAFQNYDPEGQCSASAPSGPTTVVPALPTINTRTGAQWLCSTITGTWVPGFSGQVTSGVPVAVTAAVASAAGTVTPSGPLFHITGALAITGFVIPVGCNATVRGGCSFSVIPDGTFTWTAAGNIAIAGTAVVNKVITFVWDATNSKWVPNVLS